MLWDYFVIHSYSKKPYEAISQTCSFEIVLFMDWYKQAFLIHSISPFGFEKYEQTSFINCFKHILIIVIIFPTLASMFISLTLSPLYFIANKPEICLSLYLEIIDAESNFSCSKFPSGLLWTDYCHSVLTGLLAYNFDSRAQLIIFHI